MQHFVYTAHHMAATHTNTGWKTTTSYGDSGSRGPAQWKIFSPANVPEHKISRVLI